MYRKIYNKNTRDEFIIYFKDKECTIFHREDGPAVECRTGRKEWYINDKLHREDGPAIEWGFGDDSYYLNGKKYFKDEYWAIIRLGAFS